MFDGHLRVAVAFYNHQDQLLWSRVQTWFAIQAAGIGVAYTVGHENLVVSLGALGLGLLFTVLIFFLTQRDQQIRDVNRKLVEELAEKLGSAEKTESRFRVWCDPKWPARLRGRHILWIAFATVLVADVIVGGIVLWGARPALVQASTKGPSQRAAAVGLEDWNTVVEIGQGLLTCLAIAIGGVWALWRFRWTREKWPRAEVQHGLVFRQLLPGKILVRASVLIRNTGPVLLRWKDGFVRLQQVLPCSKETLEWVEGRLNIEGRRETEGDWPLVKEVKFTAGIEEIEPGESDTLHIDFIVGEDLKTVQVYSHVSNAGKKTIGWNHTTLDDVRFEKGD
jgi:hypothetical protein